MGGTAHSSERVEDEIADRLAHRNFSVCAGIDRQTALSRHSARPRVGIGAVPADQTTDNGDLESLCTLVATLLNTQVHGS